MRFIVCIFLTVFAFQSISAQEFKKVHFDQVGNDIHIFYNLVDVKEGEEVHVSAFYRTDKSQSWKGPIRSVIGDVGENVQPGKDKKIIWDVLEDTRQLKGNLQFRLKGSIMESDFIGQSGTFTDERDNESYHWVKIGDLVWMADNLNYETKEGSWCVQSACYSGGRYYTFEKALHACPDGWHLPSNTEWQMLKEEISRRVKNKKDGEHDILSALKSVHGTGFLSAFHGYKAGDKIKLKNVGTAFWTSSYNNVEEENPEEALYILINKFNNSINSYSIKRKSGLNVRCVQEY
jgi:uncharacterized protein (TIGR02145 family)